MHTPHAPAGPVVSTSPKDPGFTPFAWAKMLYDTGYAMDVAPRTYVMGGKDADGHRVRHETIGPLRVVWIDYASRDTVTHLWVKWSDGKRHLVHRKGR